MVHVLFPCLGVRIDVALRKKATSQPVTVLSPLCVHVRHVLKWTKRWCPGKNNEAPTARPSPGDLSVPDPLA